MSPPAGPASPHPPNLTVRPYRPEDRSQVRDVCFRTGFMGEPIDWQWGDAESFADMWVAWYVDHEPESAWVLCRGGPAGGTVLGYLVGCRDTKMAASPGAVAARHVLRRGLLLRPGTAGFLWRSALDVLRGGGAPDLAVDHGRWPAHLHIDLLPEARGRGMGRALLGRWLDRLGSEGVPGVHLGTFAENTAAISFFEMCGFRRHGDPVLVPGFRTRDGARMHSQSMVRDLAGDPTSG